MGTVQTAPAGRPLRDLRAEDYLQLSLWLLITTLTLALGVALIWYIRKVMRRTDKDLSAGNELTSFRALYERGELTKEEYDRLRSKLGKRLKEELDDRLKKDEKKEPEGLLFPSRPEPKRLEMPERPVKPAQSDRPPPPPEAGPADGSANTND